MDTKGEGECIGGDTKRWACIDSGYKGVGLHWWGYKEVKKQDVDACRRLEEVGIHCGGIRRDENALVGVQRGGNALVVGHLFFL